MTAVPVAADRRERLWRFTGRLRRRHALFAARTALSRWALGLAVPVIIGAWYWPSAAWPLFGVLVVLALSAAVAAGWRARCVEVARLLHGEDGHAPTDASLDLLGCGLATWYERRKRRPDPMDAWLAEELDRGIATLPPAAIARVGRRRIGRLLWLLPIALALLLAWLLSPWLQPPWAGVVGGRPVELSPAPGDVSGAGGAAGGTGSDRGADEAPDRTDQQPAAPDPEATPDPETPPDPEAPEPPAPSEAPAPLLQLPPQQMFVVPEWIDDGPTRRVRVHAAEVGAGGAAPESVAGRGDGGAPPTPPEPRDVTFERAAERAQQARHVPPSERAIVRRFFTLLREAAK